MTGVVLRFLATVLAVPVAVWLLPGVHASSAEMALLAGVLLGLAFLVLRPLIKLLLVPLNCLTFGLVGFIADIGLVYLAAGSFRGITIEGFWWTVAVALLVWVLRETLGRLVPAGGR